MVRADTSKRKIIVGSFMVAHPQSPFMPRKKTNNSVCSEFSRGINDSKQYSVTCAQRLVITSAKVESSVVVNITILIAPIMIQWNSLHGSKRREMKLIVLCFVDNTGRKP